MSATGMCGHIPRVRLPPLSSADFLAGVVLLLAVLAAVGVATGLIVRRRLAHLDMVERALASATIATALLIVVHLVPLMLGVLARGTVLAASAVAVGLATRVRQAPASEPDELT